MDNVLSMLFNMEKKKSKTILFRYGTILRQLNRDELFNFLLTRSLKTFSDKLFYNNALKAFYCDAYDFIIKHLDEINCIQVYKDNAIQLWADDRHFARLIVFEDYDFCSNKLISSMLEELIDFAQNN